MINIQLFLDEFPQNIIQKRTMFDQAAFQEITFFVLLNSHKHVVCRLCTLPIYCLRVNITHEAPFALVTRR